MKDFEQPKPPRWADRFLEWYCNPKLLEQIQGDVHELFFWRLEERGVKSAKRAFIWDIIRLFRWKNIKRKSSQTTQFNNIAMFKNYFKIGWRNILRQKMPSFINITGLSCAIGCCLVAFMFIEPRVIRDQFHENGKNIYLVAHEAFIEGNLGKYGVFDSSLAKELPDKFPQIKRRTRMKGTQNIFRIKDNIFRSYVNYVDPDFLNSFSFPMVYGSKDALKDPSKIVIDRSAAIRFFGDEYPIDKLVKVIYDEEEINFSVGGVIEDAPNNSSIRPGFLISYEVLENRGQTAQANAVTFIELEKGTNVLELERSFQSMVSVQNGLKPDAQYESIFLVPLESMAKSNLNGVPGGSPPMAPIILLISIAGFMLLLAISNYVNIAILMATRRVKEIGIRKTIGSKRTQIIVQFLTENLILCALSVFLGIVLARGLFMPWFNEMSGGTISLNLFSNRNLWLFLGLLLLVVTFLSGFYPAVYISKYKPSVIFSGKEKLGKKWGFSGALITFQLVLSIITIVGGIMFVRTNNMQKRIEWGFDKEDKILVNIPSSEVYPELLNKMMSIPGVEEAVATNAALGEAYGNTEFYLGDKKNRASFLSCSAKYPQFMGLELHEGRFFDPELISDSQSSVMVNYKFAEHYGIRIDDLIQIDSVFHKVVGVLNDFTYQGLSDKIEPIIIKAKPDSELNYLTLKVSAGTEMEMEDKIKQAWVDVVQNKPYIGFLQSRIFDSGSEDSRGLKNTMLFTSTLATILAAMGIFGLASLSIASKMKDIGIKKALGANLIQLTKSVYLKFGIMLSIAVVIGSTLAVFIIGIFLDEVYAYHDPVNFIPLFFAAAILTIVVFLTVTTQIGKVKKMNPAETLRMD
ncbi:hypothetical protein OB69_06240 [Roseivirga seohaensis subsp. aquiponti]|uniref:ABC transporter permease n=1 Tax=Roseivirga seohaensis subsp. aquiponti TaxID=1566026 RepID=A0A0L8AMB2_9BACT|nr:ABC transporter permease [Roseivirga seohaensis]KOF03479.1 hypothetical protein OB69_06240 [Roseivirga seohaensis subsp. aquiponti]